MNKYKKIRLNKTTTRDEHRVVIESLTGKTLSKNEIVHHVDGDKSNNSPSNLKVLSRSEHSRLHMLNKVVSTQTKEKLRAKGRQMKPKAKLSIIQVKEIKKMILEKRALSGIGRIYNVDRANIWKIKAGKIYSYI